MLKIKNKNKKLKDKIFGFFVIFITISFFIISISGQINDSYNNKKNPVINQITGSDYQLFIFNDGRREYIGYGREIGYPDQREPNVNHYFNDIIKFYQDNETKLIILNITNYLDKEDNTFYTILNPYMIDDKGRKINISQLSQYREYEDIKFKFKIYEEPGAYHFYTEIKDIPINSLSPNDYTQPINYIGYDIIKSNIRLREDNLNLIIDDKLKLNTKDLKNNDFDFNLSIKGIIINTMDKVKSDGTYFDDPEIELSTGDIGYITNHSGVFDRDYSFGKVGTELLPTSTPGVPPP